MNRTLVPGILFSFFMILLGSCSSGKPPYITEVDEFSLANTSFGGLQHGLTRTQSAYYLYGSLNSDERRSKLGQYYTLYWKDTIPDQPVDLVFYHHRAGTGSALQKRFIHYGPGRSGGRVIAHFDFIGDDYIKEGRVMAWKAAILHNGQEVSHRTSYLWEDPQ